MSVKRAVKQIESPSEHAGIFSTLNVAIMLMALAFIIGTSPSYSYVSSMNSVTGYASSEPVAKIAATDNTWTENNGIDNSSIYYRCNGGCNMADPGGAILACYDNQFLSIIVNPICKQLYSGALGSFCTDAPSPQNTYIAVNCSQYTSDNLTLYCNNIYSVATTHYVGACIDNKCSYVGSANITHWCTAAEWCNNATLCYNPSQNISVQNWTEANMGVSYTYGAKYNVRTITIAAKIKTNATTGKQIIISNIGPANPDVTWLHTGGFELFVEGGKLKLGFNNYSTQTVTSSAAVNDGNWHYVAATYKAGTGTDYAGNMVLYIDGVYDNSKADAIGILPNAQNMAIAPSFSGEVDQIKLYDYALNAAQIANLTITVPTGAGTTTTMTPSENCTNHSGEWYDNNTQNCVGTNNQNIIGFNCCAIGTEIDKNCTNRIPPGELCNLSAGYTCPGNKFFSGDSNENLQCCDHCSLPGAYKTCEQMGYIRYNSSDINLTCTTLVDAIDDGNPSGMKCCGVATNTTTKAALCAGSPNWGYLCSSTLGQKCSLTSNWIASLQDNKDTAQCCKALCDQKKCTDLSPSYSLCNSANSSCNSTYRVTSNDSSSSMFCCKLACKPLGISCIAGAQVFTVRCPSGSGTVKCGADNKSYDYSGCIATSGGTQQQVVIGGPCQISGTTVPIGYRQGDTTYCSPSGTWANQLAKDRPCGNDFECKSNLCSSGKCTEVRETLALIPRIWCWLQAWILNPTSTQARQDKICSCEEDYGDPEKFETFC